MSYTRYTPSLLPGETLEALFVARERPLGLIMDRVREAAASDVRNHSLLVGPRGAGKTHLLSLVAHRTHGLIEAGARLQVSWLPEDPWTIVSYGSLLRAILDHAGRHTDPGLKDREYEALLVDLVREAGPLVVIVENLDQVLLQITPTGQSQLRHLLQTSEHLLVVASTTRLDRALTSSSEPFYNFFTTTHLEPFTVEEARLMLQTIARERGDDELATRLDSDEATARLRTIAHLAGGQPRLWSALADALTASGARGLIDTLLTRFDDLTPYYQEQLGRLSGHQRLAVAALASADHPVHVAELSKSVGIEKRSMAKTLGELRDLGWVRPTTSPFVKLVDARRTYYELAEPLARLSFQIKETRGEPLRLVVDFLTAWFDPNDADRLGADSYTARMLDEFESDATGSVIRTLSRLPSTRVPSIELLGQIDDALADLAAGEPTAVMQLRTPLRVALEARLSPEGSELPNELRRLRREIHFLALDEMGSVPHPLGSVWLRRASTLTTSLGAVDLLTAVRWQLQGWDFASAENSLIAMNLAGTSERERFTAGLFVASALISAGQLSQAIVLTERLTETATRLSGESRHETLGARNMLATAYSGAGRHNEAITLHEKNLTEGQRFLGPDHPDVLSTRNNLAAAYIKSGRHDEAIALHRQNLADRERILGRDHPDVLTSRNNLAAAYDETGRHDEAIALHRQNLADRERILGRDHPDVLTSRNNLANHYAETGHHDEAITLHEQTLADRERILGPDHPDVFNSRNNLAAAYDETRRHDEAIALHRQNLADRERILGPDHPDTLNSRNNLANSYAKAGRHEEAIVLHQQNHDDEERLFGFDHPLALGSRNDLANCYRAVGKIDLAISLYEETLSRIESIFGSDHPYATLVRDNLHHARAQQVRSSGKAE
ncbi:tetratricopeptide repeat protein [Microbacterium sp. NPDC057944]|uniref:tetratricopeptide repeat protein n=1 Tax=Microbacterium sp. NPDC057944 TaxID=3346286 RepID=UPI0036D8EB13